jgi:hypothetical protein
MSDAPDEDEIRLEDASRELGRAIWQTVLLAQDNGKAKGLLGKATRRQLVQRILDLARLVRGARP